MSDVLNRREGAVLILTLNRPESLNALTLDAARLLGERLDAASRDPGVRAVVTGAGSAFSAGGDTKFLLEIPGMSDDELRRVVYGTFQRPVRAIRAIDKPVIAAVNSATVGAGCELAVAADIRMVSEQARFGEIWIRIGCVPALGGMYLLPRIVGLDRATELILTGETIDAAEAQAHRPGQPRGPSRRVAGRGAGAGAFARRRARAYPRPSEGRAQPWSRRDALGGARRHRRLAPRVLPRPRLCRGRALADRRPRFSGE
ncbi:MAG: enoyl-CoA hydratase/isomerase family protein [Candidatus Rokuibacteriota bacterium]